MLGAVAQWESGNLDFGDTIAEDFVRYDTRRSIATPTLHGRAAFIENVRAIYGVFDTILLDPIAIRGDRVAILRVTLGHEGFTATMLGVYETDDRGLLVRGTSFDEEDLDLALAELEERFMAGEGAPGRDLHSDTRWTEASAARMDALNRGDRDAVLATYTPDFIREDRRRGINFGTSNREETVDALLAGNDVGLGNRSFTTVEAIGDNFALGEFRMSHDDGFELVYLLAVEQDDAGRLRRATNLDLEDRADASALLRAWAAERDETGEPS